MVEIVKLAGGRFEVKYNFICNKALICFLSVWNGAVFNVADQRTVKVSHCGSDLVSSPGEKLGFDDAGRAGTKSSIERFASHSIAVWLCIIK